MLLSDRAIGKTITSSSNALPKTHRAVPKMVSNRSGEVRHTATERLWMTPADQVAAWSRTDSAKNPLRFRIRTFLAVNLSILPFGIKLDWIFCAVSR